MISHLLSPNGVHLSVWSLNDDSGGVPFQFKLRMVGTNAGMGSIHDLTPLILGKVSESFYSHINGEMVSFLDNLYDLTADYYSACELDENQERYTKHLQTSKDIYINSDDRLFVALGFGCSVSCLLDDLQIDKVVKNHSCGSAYGVGDIVYFKDFHYTVYVGSDFTSSNFIQNTIPDDEHGGCPYIKYTKTLELEPIGRDFGGVYNYSISLPPYTITNEDVSSQNTLRSCWYKQLDDLVSEGCI